jgi:L-amino acid N-acyltransferase YncA
MDSWTDSNSHTGLTLIGRGRGSPKQLLYIMLALWKKLGAPEMVGRIAPCNTASIRLAEKLKFDRLEPVRDDVLPDGTHAYRWLLDPSKI